MKDEGGRINSSPRRLSSFILHPSTPPLTLSLSPAYIGEGTRCGTRLPESSVAPGAVAEHIPIGSLTCMRIGVRHRRIIGRFASLRRRVTRAPPEQADDRAQADVAGCFTSHHGRPHRIVRRCATRV